MPEFYMYKNLNSGATSTYIIGYRIPGEDHILCTGMYNWQVEWLLKLLKAQSTYPKLAVEA